ncbi:MAG: hypothetical protein AAF961_11470, partial [Planctomycetota bacterium]
MTGEIKGDARFGDAEFSPTELEIKGPLTDLAWGTEGGVTQFGVLGDAYVEIGDGARVDTNDAIIGFFGSAQAQVDVHSGGRLQSNNVTIGLFDSEATSGVTLEDDSKWSLAGFLEVGRIGQAKVEVLENSTLDVQGLVVLSSDVDSTSDVRVESANGLSTEATFEVGRRGDALLTVAGGGRVVSEGDAFLGTFQEGVGSVVVERDSVFAANGNLNIGNGAADGPADGVNGTGSFAIKDGGQLILADGKEIRIGRRNGSVGTLTISGADAVVSSDGEGPVTVNVGVDGQGELIVEKGFKLDTEKIDVNLGRTGLGKGTLTIKDVGTEISYKDAVVGEDGIGLFRVQQGATARVQERLVIGESNTEVMSELTVTGQNSTLEVGKEIVIGESGSGALIVEQGGKVSLNDDGFERITLGKNADSRGELTIKGKAATVDFDVNVGQLVIGDEGEGTLKLVDGGLFILTKPTKDQITLAAKNSSTANIEVSGREGDQPSRLGLDSDVIIGAVGTADVTVSDGGLLQGRPGADITAIVGGSDDAGGSESNKGTGKVTITGKDSQWQVPGTLVIGNAEGVGTVRVAGG